MVKPSEFIVSFVWCLLFFLHAIVLLFLGLGNYHVSKIFCIVRTCNQWSRSAGSGVVEHIFFFY